MKMTLTSLCLAMSKRAESSLDEEDMELLLLKEMPLSSMTTRELLVISSVVVISVIQAGKEVEEKPIAYACLLVLAMMFSTRRMASALLPVPRAPKMIPIVLLL